MYINGYNIVYIRLLYMLSEYNKKKKRLRGCAVHVQPPEFPRSRSIYTYSTRYHFIRGSANEAQPRSPVPPLSCRDRVKDTPRLRAARRGDSRASPLPFWGPRALTSRRRPIAAVARIIGIILPRLCTPLSASLTIILLYTWTSFHPATVLGLYARKG